MMTAKTEIATDLITPLGAYLRFRDEGRATFLLESVERGRLGRYSFVGAGGRVLPFEEAETLGVPLVGYLGYDFVAKLEPTVPLPDDGPGFPESAFVVADTLVRFDHGRGGAEAPGGDPAEVAELLKGPQPPFPRGAGRSGPLCRFPDQAEHEARVRRAQEYIRAGDAFQVVIAQRAERPTSASALELYRALRRVNPSPYLFLLELEGLALVGSSPETVVKCEGDRRGIYAGAVGYALPSEAALATRSSGRAVHPRDRLKRPVDTFERATTTLGTLDTCIAIRTLVLRDGIAHLQAGGGIVADSDPTTEHEECLRKLAAVETAIELAEKEQRGSC